MSHGNGKDHGHDQAILVDVTRCTGCEKCVDACKEINDLGKDQPRRWKKRIDDLSSTRYTTIVRRPGNRFVRQFCRHCLEPACVSACIVGALQKTPDGPARTFPHRRRSSRFGAGFRVSGGGDGRSCIFADFDGDNDAVNLGLAPVIGNPNTP